MQKSSIVVFGTLRVNYFSVIWLDIVYVDNLRHRVTACGYQSGIVTLTMVDVDTSGTINIVFNPYVKTGFSHPYHLDEFMAPGVIFHFSIKFL